MIVGNRFEGKKDVKMEEPRSMKEGAQQEGSNVV